MSIKALGPVHYTSNVMAKAKKLNKCFSGHFFEKQIRQAGFYFLYFISPKTYDAIFLLFFSSKTNGAPFFVHFK